MKIWMLVVLVAMVAFAMIVRDRQKTRESVKKFL
jgi:hypothetical protein